MKMSSCVVCVRQVALTFNFVFSMSCCEQAASAAGGLFVFQIMVYLVASFITVPT